MQSTKLAAKPADFDEDVGMDEEAELQPINISSPKKEEKAPEVKQETLKEASVEKSPKKDAPQTNEQPLHVVIREESTSPNNINAGIAPQDIRVGTDSENQSMVRPTSPSSSPFQKSASRISVSDYDKPNPDKFRKKMDQMHARKENGERYSRTDALFRFTTGWHYFVGTTQKCDADKFGIGMVLYFRFLKFMIMWFCIAAILSVPVIYFCVQATTEYLSLSVTNYKQALYATTLGPIAEESAQCFKADIGDTITFTCPVGTIGSFSYFEYGRVVETKSMTCDHFSYYSWDTLCNAATNGSSAIETQYSSCVGLTSCSLTVSSDFFDFSASSACNAWNPSSSSYDSSKEFYFQVLCQNIQMQAISGLPASKFTIGIIVASLDCAIAVLYIIFLFTLKRLEKKAKHNLLGVTEPIESHTIEVKSLPTNMNLPDLRVGLWEKFNKKIVVNEEIVNVYVVDVQIAEPNAMLHLQAELADIKQKKVSIARKLYKKWTMKNKSQLGPDVDIEILRKLADETNNDDNSAKAKKEKANRQKEFKTLEKVQHKQEKIEAKMEQLRNTNKTKAVSAFITFETSEQRDAVYAHYQRSPLARFWNLICCCTSKNDPLVMENKYLKVVYAPSPDDINWRNINTSFVEKFIRRFISWVLTFAFWVITFALITYVRDEESTLSESLQPSAICSTYTDLTEAEALADSALGSSSVGLMECYCTDDVKRIFTNSNCKYLQSKYIASQSLPFLVVVAVILVNFVLQIIFNILSAFEKHKSATSQSVSRVIKIFVAQALNTGVIILIVNIKFHNTSIPNILGGTYDDVSPDWFLEVATTLLITMLINVVSLPIMTLFGSSIKLLLQFCDRGCTSDRERTKKKSQEAWENLYLGPEFLMEFRYAQILTVIFVCMLYSPGVPLLFVSSCAQFFIFYTLDKYYLLRIYRIPKRYDQHLQTMVVNILYFALILHTGNAVWMYGNIKIFGDSASLTLASSLLTTIKDSNTPGIFSNLVSRAFQDQNLSLAILFVLVVVAYIIQFLFKNSVIRLFALCKRKINRNKVKEKVKSKYEDHKYLYFKRIKTESIELEIKYIEKELFRVNNDRLRALLEDRLEKLRRELSSREEAGKREQESEEESRAKFQGIFSYHIGHNPTYKRFFETKGLEEPLSPKSEI